MKLVLIESSGKQETVQKYLGKDYKVFATKGHVRDLPVKTLGVDIDKNFAPDYQIMSDKKKLVTQLKDLAKKSDEILFATDPDREGEAIAWHLYHILGIDPKTPARIVFNEISKNAVQHALEKPRAIDINLVDAQQARRVLDRLVGYKLSPIVCNKIQNKLSAGRVQSVTLRLVVDRDREIENFKPEEYWSLTCIFTSDNGEEVKASLVLPKKSKISTKAEMDEVLKDITSSNFVVSNVKRTETKSHPQAPFTTSSMVQDALNKLGMNSKVTSATAQILYEGVDVAGEGKVPLITYIRTDSTRISEEAQAKALTYIENHYGKNYCPKTPNIYKSKKNIQDAHEAIRPITLDRTPASLKGKIEAGQYKLYKLIYERFLASQMADARFDTCAIDIESSVGNHTLRANGKVMTFDGYTVLYTAVANPDESDDASATLPNLTEGDKLNLKETKPEQKFTKPPAKFSEASLVKTMEDKGIGRPATYSPTVNTLLSRNYIEREGKFLKSTELGRNVVDLLERNFSDIMDVGFTADMENKLDTIEEGGKVWQNVIKDFYAGFQKELMEAQKDRYKVPAKVEETDEVCEKCGAKMVIRNGKFGRFMACSNFPECKNTKPIVEIVGKCPKCGRDLVKKMSKKNKVFYGCTGFPACDFASWDLPYKDKCPKCGEYMVVKKIGNYNHIKCSACDYQTKEKIETTGEDNNDTEES